MRKASRDFVSWPDLTTCAELFVQSSHELWQFSFSLSNRYQLGSAPSRDRPTILKSEG